MEYILTIIILVLVVALVTIFFMFNRKISQIKLQAGGAETLGPVLDLIKTTQQELALTRQEIQKNLSQNSQLTQDNFLKSNRLMHERLDKATDVIMGVNKEIGKMQELGRSIKDLQDFLRSPKLRGNIGEHVLRDLLEQYFSNKHFDIQYKFNAGQIVDAIIRTDKGIIPIDAKFPFENFQKMAQSDSEEEQDEYLRVFLKDVKKHIKDISKKYILPNEGTLDFAIMYIPSEAIYYEIIRHNDDINDFAYEQRVFPVSPNSFYYFLKVIMIGLEGKKIEQAAESILDSLEAIRKDNEKFADHLHVLTSHVNNAKGAVDRVNLDYGQLSLQIDQVRRLKDI